MKQAITDCICPADAEERTMPMLVPKDELFDEWKATKKMREYDEVEGVHHSWIDSDGQRWGISHRLDKEVRIQ